MAGYTYGLIDWDLFMLNSQAMFNLDLMKMSTYLKRNGKFVKFFTELDATNLDYYNTVYIFKNVDDGYYPVEFFSAPNVEVLGAVVGGGKTMLPPEVEECNPDMYVYLKAKKFFNRKPIDKRHFDDLNEAVHLRLSRDGEHINPDWLDPLHKLPVPMGLGGRVLHIHDRYITDIPGGWDAVNEAADQEGRISPHRIWFKYPLVCYTDDEFLAWRSFKKHNMTRRYELHFVPELETLFRGVQMKTTPAYRKEFRKGGEKSVIFINIPWKYSTENFLSQMYGWYVFAIYARRRQTSLQIRLPRNTYLHKDLQDFVSALNTFLRFEDITPAVGQRAKIASFTQHLEERRKFETQSYSTKMAYWQGVSRVLLYLKAEQPEFYRALDEFNYLDYDKETKQLIGETRGGRHE